MKQILFPLLATIAFIAAIGIFVGKAKSTPLSPRKEIKIGTLKIQIEIADTPEERKKGLSGVKSLPENEGMLFVFGEQNLLPSFWMKEMLIPIDIIWINDGKVAKIHKNVQPEPEGTKLTLYYPDGPIDYVLEVNAGFSDKNTVKNGDSVDLSGI